MRRHKKYVARKCQNLLFQRCARPCIKSGRRLVQHDQIGLTHERPAHGQHLLFPAGQSAALLPAAFGLIASSSCAPQENMLMLSRMEALNTKDFCGRSVTCLRKSA